MRLSAAPGAPAVEAEALVQLERGEVARRHGFEGVRQIEGHVTTTMGWSATTVKSSNLASRRSLSRKLTLISMRESLNGG